MPPDKRKKILFICAHNSARSQMAEALVHRFMPGKYQDYSAGTVPNPSRSGDTDEGRLAAFRRVRDQIWKWLESNFETEDALAG